MLAGGLLLPLHVRNPKNSRSCHNGGMNLSASSKQRPAFSGRRVTYKFNEEPPDMKGLLFQQEQDGSVQILARSGETDPDSSPDIPDSALHGDQVFISVDGIGQDWSRHREQIRDWFQGNADYGVDLGGTVIGIHEGEGKNALSDGWRIVKNTALLKALQDGVGDVDKLRDAAYANDPSVKTIHDQLAQSLKVGRKITFMAHSGGASQVALALSLFSQADSQRQLIEENVRVLGTAPAASSKDFVLAGVRDENVLVTGSKRDPVFQIFKNFWRPRRPWTLLPVVGQALWTGAKFVLKSGPFHQGEYIFEQNRTANSHRIGEFLEGGTGGQNPLP